MKTKIPVSDKINISVREASELSSIPYTTIKKMIRQPDCPFLLYPEKAGRKTLIKRREFEAFIENGQAVEQVLFEHD